MANPLSHSVAHACHPATPTRNVRAAKAHLRRTDNGALAITFCLDADLAQLRIPPIEFPHTADRLWEHTCFEAFVGVNDQRPYYEFNLAPSRAWAVHVLRNYRDGAPLKHENLAPEIAVRRTDIKLEVDALLQLYRLPGFELTAALRLALSAVIEDAHGLLSYWALKHPPGKPDFHHPDAFVLTLEPLISAT